MRIEFRVREVTKAELHGFAITEYRDEVADLLNAFKERGQRALGELLAKELVMRLPKQSAQLLISAPSSARNFASRGFVPAEVIARVLSRAWRIPLLPLRLARAGSDQSTLDRSHRLSNLVGGMYAPRPLRQVRALLVDDIVTTGATLTEMSRAVSEAGGVPTGFITVAETIPKSRTKI